MKYTTCTCGSPGWTTVRCCNACGLPVDGQHWHIPELTEARKRIEELEARLADEITWGHQRCTSDNCLSSGTDCPKTEQQENNQNANM